jgi:ribonuclease HII
MLCIEKVLNILAIFHRKFMLEIRYNKKMLYETATDECGRGCGAGPVVAAAVILPLEYLNEKIKDSKKVSKKNRNLLYDEIIKNAIAYSIQESSVEEIEAINILQASQLAMRKAILEIEKTEYIIVDGNYWKDELKIPYATIVKGDAKYLGIAAASILAKVHRDRIMCKLAIEFPQYGWEKNKGYLVKKHFDAIRKFGITKHHRKSFIHV